MSLDGGKNHARSSDLDIGVLRFKLKVDQDHDTGGGDLGEIHMDGSLDDINFVSQPRFNPFLEGGELILRCFQPEGEPFPYSPG